ncbi:MULTISPECIES: YdcF family protein [Bosea]|uniref:YdcF family protein n=1 Tax=Bosea TaxID=85413 RepID=UPI0021504AAA|nr:MULTISPECIES: YdcF family protein [Bosea]MCR4523803.1 YdcF family protein [Bosea sp. 47.2.35]MDR6830379.1 vancomycin permeability regulator SanA [Bosea robiniae]MDR6897134.1 vancomycin permeability regulator SanA [Bosea sp. BE109]MDR7140531.1 vancomycin permeability regulator SanA [Bosea sp. BE168]MDR7177148.1 vancomycin permeability regulator SanA [Bosea sp. BE271]
MPIGRVFPVRGSGVLLWGALCGIVVYVVAAGAVIMMAERSGRDAVGLPHPAAAVVFYDDSPVQRKARVAYAVERFRAGDVQYLVMAGGWRPGRGGYQGAREMVEDARGMGVPDAALRYDAGSNDTVSNLRQAMALVPDLGVRAVVMISDSFHIPRIASLAPVFCADFECRFWPAPVPMTWWVWFVRINHELAAQAARLLPRGLLEIWFDYRRHAGIAQEGGAQA